MLNEDPSASEHDYPRGGVPEYRELNRQLAALGEHVARAQSRLEDQIMLRAELATLLSFAATLRADAEAWRSALPGRLKELERHEAAVREQRDRLAAERDRMAAEREALVRQRDDLQWRIDQTAERLAQDTGGECRRTLPVLTLGEHLSVCSITVRSPRRGFRPWKCWLVTLSNSRDEVLVTRSYG
jgi:small-conductance mechanosensitive channel